MATKVYSTISMKHEGCKSAPNDSYSLQSIENILVSVKQSNGQKWWYHTYQNAFPWLHSDLVRNSLGESPETRVFTVKDFKHAVVDGDFHSQLGRNESLWQQLTQRMTQ